MRNGFHAEHYLDLNGNPAGGLTKGLGIDIIWQNGPLGLHAEDCNTSDPSGRGCTELCHRKEPNGAFVEDVIDAAIDRIQFYQKSKFNCRENAIALTCLETALLWLDKRTKERVKRNVEGTHEV